MGSQEQSKICRSSARHQRVPKQARKILQGTNLWGDMESKETNCSEEDENKITELTRSSLSKHCVIYIQ